MSILLDAVSRSKQQQQGEFDPVSSPRPLYSEPKSSLSRPVKALILPGALALAIAAAWGVNSFLLQESGASVQQTFAPVKDTTPAAAPESSVAIAQAHQPLETQLDASDQGVRLAGKAALPAPVSLEPQRYGVAATQADPNDGLSYEVAEETAEARAARLEALMAAGVTDEQRRAFDEVMHIEESRPRQVLTQQQTVTPPRDQGIAALQAEVDKAAAEFGLHRAQPLPQTTREATAEKPLSGDALVQAFEAALKEVEFNQSINQEVTPEPLATIPKTSDYPRYGDLPAGLQLMVPEFNIMAHVYSNDPAQRWLNVDGKELQEGDSIQGKLRIVEIRPRDVVLDIDGTAFKVPAI